MAIYNGDLLMKARGLQGQEKSETPAKKQHTANKTYKEAAERKDQLVYATQEIKARLKMQDVLDRYYHTGPHNKICCPFHEEKTPSFSYKDDFYKCFGCGESGDTIKFVQRFFDLPFAEAVQKLDDDFGFGNLHPLTESQKAEIGKRRQQSEEKRLQEQQKADERNGLLDELAHLDQEKERLRPQLAWMKYRFRNGRKGQPKSIALKINKPRKEKKTWTSLAKTAPRYTGQRRKI